MVELRASTTGRGDPRFRSKADIQPGRTLQRGIHPLFQTREQSRTGHPDF